MKKLNKKIYTINVIFFFVTILIILSFLNNLYHTLLISPKFKNPYEYEIIANQFYEYKSNALEIIMDKLFLKLDKNSNNKPTQYNLKKIKTNKSSVFVNNPKTVLTSRLLTNNFDNELIEDEINKIYFYEINKLINEFNLNYYLFKDPDYTAIKYTNLTASDFFQKYLPPSIMCSITITVFKYAN